MMASESRSVGAWFVAITSKFVVVKYVDGLSSENARITISVTITSP